MTFLGTLKQEFSFIKGNYAILVTSWILLDFATELPGTYYSLYVLNLGATETILGVIGFSSFLALASMQFPGGYLTDKFGRRWLITSMTLGVGSCYLFYAFAPSWHAILIGAVLMNVINSIYQPALSAMIADSLPPERRGMGFGIIMLIANVSTTPGPYFAGILHNRFGLDMGMRIGYGVTVGLFVAAVILRLKLKETVVRTSKLTFHELLRAYPVGLKEGFAVWKRVPSSAFYMTLSSVVNSFGFAFVQLYLVVYAVRVLGIAESVWPFVLMILFVTMIALAIPAGKIVDKVNRKVPILVGLVLAGVAMWLFVNGDFVRVVVALILFGVANVTLNAGWSALQVDLVPKEERGKVSGFNNFANCVMMALGNLIGGFLYDNVAPWVPFYGMIAMLIPSFVLMLFLVHEPEKREE